MGNTSSWIVLGSLVLSSLSIACSSSSSAGGVTTDGGTASGDDGGSSVALDGGVATDASAEDAGPPRKVIFITREFFDVKTSGFNGIAKADELCKSWADAKASKVKGKTWKVWMSDSKTNARDRLSNSALYVRVDGKVIGTLDDLTHGTMKNPVGLDEYGTAAVIMSSAVTGTAFDGQADTAGTCGDWLDTSPGREVTLGDPTKTDSSWTNSADFAEDCSSLGGQFYCVEQ